MKMVSPSLIRNIDEYAIGTLGVGARALMERSGHAVADAVRARVARGSKVVVLAGKGNNGGDGYAAALELMRDYAVAVCDVFGAGQRSEEGKFFLAAYLRAGGEIRSLPDDPDFPARLNEADCIVDAIFGTGFCGELPEELRPLALALRRAAGVEKIAIDLPLGVNAEDGSVSDVSASFGATVELTFPKRGVVSYPARSCAGALIFADLGLPLDEIAEHFSLKDRYIDFEDCAELLPEREENSHKGSFGKLLVVTGSELYRGAADLSLSAALRGGCGSVTFLGSEKLCGALAAKYPEALYRPADLSEGDEAIERAVALAAGCSAVLVGCGSGNTEALRRFVLRLLGAPGGPLILDADAINALSVCPEEGREALRRAVRPVVLTPHPLEFSRLSECGVDDVQRHRIARAVAFARAARCVLLLKGAATIVTDGETLFVNSAGTSALAKAGSGDVLAGFLASLVASGAAPLPAAAIAAYLHAAAAQDLAEEFSSFGVTPSDLPPAIARRLAHLQKSKKKTV